MVIITNLLPRQWEWFMSTGASSSKTNSNIFSLALIFRRPRNTSVTETSRKRFPFISWNVIYSFDNLRFDFRTCDQIFMPVSWKCNGLMSNFLDSKCFYTEPLIQNEMCCWWWNLKLYELIDNSWSTDY